MSNFTLFNIYLILTVTSVCSAVLSLIRRNHDMFAAMVILFLLSIIGLSSNFAGWMRGFAGLYGITLLG